MVGLTEHPHYVYDRYSLIVAVVLWLGISWIALKFWSSHRSNLAVMAGSMAVFVVLGAASFKQAAVWNNATTFLPYMISKLGAHPVPPVPGLLHRGGSRLGRPGRPGRLGVEGHGTPYTSSVARQASSSAATDRSWSRSLSEL